MAVLGVPDVESVARIVTEKEPLAEGVPPIVAPDSVRPVGSAPAVIAHV